MITVKRQHQLGQLSRDCSVAALSRVYLVTQSFVQQRHRVVRPLGLEATVSSRLRRAGATDSRRVRLKFRDVCEP